MSKKEVIQVNLAVGPDSGPEYLPESFCRHHRTQRGMTIA